MQRTRMTYSGLLYLDRTLPLLLDQVRPEGVDLNYVVCASPGDLFRRQAQYAQFEISEMSASTYISMIGRGDNRFVGLPLFISRNFRHSQVYLNKNAGISEPEELRGKRVGLVEYQITAALWIRAFLAEDYGVTPEDVSWFEGGLIEPAWAERMSMELPPGVSLQHIGPGKTLEGMLETGELDALVTVQPPQTFGAPSSSIVRLFPDFESVEREYHRRTRHFPIMHLVVLRRDVYEQNRWAALSLYEAFEQAKAQGAKRLRAITGLAVSLPWLGGALKEIDTEFGGDAFPYGVEANKHTLEAMTRYVYEQGMSRRLVGVDELFAIETYQAPINL